MSRKFKSFLSVLLMVCVLVGSVDLSVLASDENEVALNTEQTKDTVKVFSEDDLKEYFEENETEQSSLEVVSTEGSDFIIDTSIVDETETLEEETKVEETDYETESQTEESSSQEETELPESEVIDDTYTEVETEDEETEESESETEETEEEFPVEISFSAPKGGYVTYMISQGYYKVIDTTKVYDEDFLKGKEIWYFPPIEKIYGGFSVEGEGIVVAEKKSLTSTSGYGVVDIVVDTELYKGGGVIEFNAYSTINSTSSSISVGWSKTVTAKMYQWLGSSGRSFSNKWTIAAGRTASPKTGAQSGICWGNGRWEIIFNANPFVGTVLEHDFDSVDDTVLMACSGNLEGDSVKGSATAVITCIDTNATIDGDSYYLFRVETEAGMGAGQTGEGYLGIEVSGITDKVEFEKILTSKSFEYNSHGGAKLKVEYDGGDSLSVDYLYNGAYVDTKTGHPLSFPVNNITFTVQRRLSGTNDSFEDIAASPVTSKNGGTVKFKVDTGYRYRIREETIPDNKLIFKTSGWNYFDTTMKNSKLKIAYDTDTGNAWKNPYNDITRKGKFVNNYYDLTKLKIIKRDSVSGATISKAASDAGLNWSGIRFNFYTDSSATKLIYTQALDSNGTLTTPPMFMPGSNYYVREDPTSPLIAGGYYSYDSTVHTISPKGQGDYKAEIELTVTNTSTYPVKIYKQIDPATASITYGNPLYPIAGAEYTIYSNAACTTRATFANGTVMPVLKVGTTDSYTNAVNILRNTNYYIKETKGPDVNSGAYGQVYEIDTTVYTVNISSSYTHANGFYTVWSAEKPRHATVGLEIKKVDKDGNVSDARNLGGAVFEVHYKTTGRKWYFESNNMGVVNTLDEGRLAQGYSSSALYKNTSGAIIYPVGEYTITEKKAPKGYELNSVVTGGSDSFDIPLRVGSDSSVTFGAVRTVANETLWGSVRIYKFDSELDKNKEQGDAEFPGTAFQIISDTADGGNYYRDSTITTEKHFFNKGEVMMTITIPEGGKYAEVPPRTLGEGDYIMREVIAGEGYMIPTGREVDFTIDVDSEIEELEDNRAIKNDPMRGGLEVTKLDKERNESKAQGDATLENTRLRLTNKSKNAILYRNLDGSETLVGVDEYVEFFTDVNGFYKTHEKALPYGTYQLEEMSPPIGYLLGSTTVNRVIDFTIREDGQVVRCNFRPNAIEDQVIRGNVTIQKWDKELNTNKPQGASKLDGGELTIYNRSKASVLVDIDGNGLKEYGVNDAIITIITDTTGTATTRDRLLPYGTYEIVETKAPEGYLLGDTTVNRSQTFSIRTDGQHEEFKTTDRAVKDQIIRGDFEITKFRKEDITDDESDAYVPLKDIIFSLISDTTGEIYKLRTDENGFATTADIKYLISQQQWNPRGTLEYDTYTVTEDNTPEGLKPIDPFKITISEDGVTLKDYFRDNQKITSYVRVIKVDSETGKVVPIANTTFRVLDSNKEVMNFLVAVYPQPQYETEFCTDESGTFMIPQKLDYGTYYLEELQAPHGYLKGNLLEFKVDRASKLDDPIIVEYPDDNAKGKVRIEKFDKNTGKALAGAEFTVNAVEDVITPDNTLRYAKDEVVDVIVTDENGYAESIDLYLGDYQIVESKQPVGYMGDYVPRQFSLVYKDQLTPLVYADYKGEEGFYNKRTELQLFKKDIDDMALEGIVFEFIPVNEIGNGNEESYYRVTDSEGLLHWDLLAPGRYRLREVQTLEGYVLDTTERFVVVRPDGSIYEEGFETEERLARLELVWINDYTKVRVDKVDPDYEYVKGAIIQVVNDLGEIKKEFTTEGEEIYLYKLPAGDYKLIEIEAPSGWALQRDVEFTIREIVDVQTVTMVNKKVTVDKVDVTGEEEVIGAKMQVLDKDGNVVDEWISDGTPHDIQNIIVGEDYTLSEVVVPEGYVKAEDIEFNVDGDTNQWINMVDKQIFVSKKSVTGEDELDGATLSVYDLEGNLMDTWVSGTKQHPISNLVIGGTYILKEEIAADGYVIASDIEFTVTAEPVNQYIEMIDKQVFVSKTDVTGQLELPGAKLKVYDVEGNLIDEWTSTEVQHPISGLRVDNTYVLHEEIAPEGYVIASSIEFYVDDDGKVQTVTMVDKQVFVSKTDITGDEELEGAELKVYDSEGTLVDEWTSTKERHPIKGLKVKQTYTLHEEIAPNGYVIASDIEFYVEDDGSVQTVHMTDKQVFVSKTDITGDEELEGAELKVYDLEGNLIDEWTSTSERHAISGLEVNRGYILHEEIAPEGYVIASDIEFFVENDNTIQTVHMVDKQVFVSKKDITTKEELPGARLTVEDKDGKKVDEWISTEEQHPVVGLEVGETYTLIEEIAPDGYVRAEEIEFTVKDNGKVQTVTMKDDYTKVEISKKDVTTGKELPGAHLELYNEDGDLIEEWVSTNEPKYFERLPVGKYTLHEDLAPIGYKVASDVVFEVEETGEIQKVVMHDEPVPKLSSPKTGVETDFVQNAILALLSIICFLILYKKRQKFIMQ